MDAAFIPLRGGSKSIPGKNILPLAGRPLAYWTVAAAAACEQIDRVFVATDDPAIAETVRAFGLSKVEIIGRSPETATDSATTESAMLEFAQQQSCERIVLIQATSPLLTPEDLARGFRKLEESRADTVLSVVSQKRFIWTEATDGFATPQNYDPAARPRRQEFAPYYVENGAFYICDRVGFLRERVRLFGRIAIVPMAEEAYLELDEPADRVVIEQLLRNRQKTPAASGPAIRLVLTDVDGVLTDAGMYYGEAGDELKKFNTRDGKGLELLRNDGVKIGIITTEDTKIVARRAMKLKVDIVHQGVTDKRTVANRIREQLGLRWEEVAFIGDDLNDLELLRAVGFSACPADAVEGVRSAVHYVCRAKGGEGCVRELAEKILFDRSIAADRQFSLA